jgi:hypothetical protein
LHEGHMEPFLRAIPFRRYGDSFKVSHALHVFHVSSRV